MNATLGEKALSTKHFTMLMFPDTSKHILSSPTFMEDDLASGTGMDHATHRALVWQLWGQSCSDFPFLCLLPPGAGCEAVPWVSEETGACAGGHQHLPPEDPQHCLRGALLPPDVWGSSWLRQEDGGRLPVCLCSVLGSSLWLFNVRQCVIGIIFLVFSLVCIQIGAWLYHQTLPKCTRAPKHLDVLNCNQQMAWVPLSLTSLFCLRSVSGLPW